MSEGHAARGASSPPFFKVVRSGQPSPVLALVFSHVHEPAGRFTFERTVCRLGIDAILLNAPQRTYYLRGVPGLGADVAAVAASLRQQIAEIAPQTVIAIGLSMGAFGAALYGALLGVDRVLALGGETMLQLPRSRSRAFIADRFVPSHPDLRPLVREATTTRFDLVFGQNDLIDLYSAWRLRDLGNVRLYPVRQAPHEIARWLQQRDALVPFLEAAVLDRPFSAFLELGDALQSPMAVPNLYAAQAALWEGEPEVALMRIRSAVRALPDLPLAQFYLGRALERTGAHAAAIEAFRRAMALDPTRLPTRLGLARSLIATGEAEEAAELVGAVLAEQPRNALAHHLRGILLARQGAGDAAAQAQREAMALDPANASFPLELGRLQIGARRYEDAIEALRRATQLSPRQPYPHYLLGRAHAALGRMDAAGHAFARALALKPESATYRQAFAALTSAAA